MDFYTEMLKIKTGHSIAKMYYEHTRKQAIWVKLQADAFDSGLVAELCEFFLENPNLSIEQLDKEFRQNWNI